MTWPVDVIGRPDVKLDEIITYAMGKSGAWMDVLAHAVLCRADEEHGAHDGTTDANKYEDVLQAWADTERRIVPVASFCLNEMNHGGGGRSRRKLAEAKRRRAALRTMAKK